LPKVKGDQGAERCSVIGEGGAFRIDSLVSCPSVFDSIANS
jgi:hypothetical protein